MPESQLLELKDMVSINKVFFCLLSDGWNDISAINYLLKSVLLISPFANTDLFVDTFVYDILLNEFGYKSAILQTFSKYVEAMNIGMYLVQSNYFLSKIKLIANPMSSSLKMQLACIKLKLVKIMKR